MKFFAGLMMLVGALTLAGGGDMRGKVTEYGIFQTIGEEHIEKTPDAPSGYSRRPDASAIVKTTDRIPAKMGLRFGISYQIDNVRLPDGEHDVQVNFRYPQMTRPDGKTSTEFTLPHKCLVKDGRAYGGRRLRL